MKVGQKEGRERMKAFNQDVEAEIQKENGAWSEMDVIRALVDARTSQCISQKELAERTGISQADISKIENGARNPSLEILKRLAKGMGMRLKLEFIPETHGM